MGKRDWLTVVVALAAATAIIGVASERRGGRATIALAHA